MPEFNMNVPQITQAAHNIALATTIQETVADGPVLKRFLDVCVEEASARPSLNPGRLAEILQTLPKAYGAQPFYYTGAIPNISIGSTKSVLTKTKIRVWYRKLSAFMNSTQMKEFAGQLNLPHSWDALVEQWHRVDVQRPTFVKQFRQFYGMVTQLFASCSLYRVPVDNALDRYVNPEPLKIATLDDLQHARYLEGQNRERIIFGDPTIDGVSWFEYSGFPLYLAPTLDLDDYYPDPWSFESVSQLMNDPVVILWNYLNLEVTND